MLKNSFSPRCLPVLKCYKATVTAVLSLSPIPSLAWEGGWLRVRQVQGWEVPGYLHLHRTTHILSRNTHRAPAICKVVLKRWGHSSHKTKTLCPVELSFQSLWGWAAGDGKRVTVALHGEYAAHSTWLSTEQCSRNVSCHRLTWAHPLSPGLPQGGDTAQSLYKAVQGEGLSADPEAIDSQTPQRPGTPAVEVGALAWGISLFPLISSVGGGGGGRCGVDRRPYVSGTEGALLLSNSGDPEVEPQAPTTPASILSMIL